MDQVNESSPLNPPSSVKSPQNRSQVLSTMRQAVSDTFSTSNIIMSVIIILTTTKILSQIIVLLFARTTTEEPLALWVLGYCMLDLSYLSIFLSKLHYVRQMIDGEAEDSSGCMNSALRAMNGVYLLWFIPGNFWYWSCEDCYEDAPALTILTIVLLIIGYLYYSGPVIALACMVACLPVSIGLLFYVANNSNTAATEEMINRLKVDRYDPEQHKGDSTCSICAAEFCKNGEVIVLDCDTRHIFHEDCIKKWLRINTSCPICRAPFMARQV